MSYTPNQEKLTVNSSGDLTVSKLTTGTVGSTAINLQVNGQINASDNITAFSDLTLKENVQTIDNALNKIEALTGVTYFKDGKKSIGLIAQNVESVIPEAVSKNGDYLAVAYGNLVGVLIQAIKELNAEIKELKENK